MSLIIPRQVFLGCFILACSGGISYGQSVYKAIDEEGKVTYSTEPPDDETASQTLDLLTEPSDKDIAAAQQRNEKVQRKLDKKQEDRHRQAERNAQAPATGPGTVVLVQPNPPALYYPYATHGYWPHRRGHRYDYGHNYGHHYRDRFREPYRPSGPSLIRPGHPTPFPFWRYSSRSRY